METLCDTSSVDIFSQIPDSADVPAVPTWHPTASQSRGLDQLHELASVFEKVGDGLLAGFQPSCRRALVIGTSGSGKSALARQFAAQRGVPIHCIDGGSWVVQGSQKTGTLRQVRDFVRSCDDQSGSNDPEGRNGPGLQGIIWIDEADKMVPTQAALSESAWSLSVASEGISLADSDSRLAGHDWRPRDIQRLRQNFMLLAGGAFMGALAQVRQTSKRGSLGFGESGEKISYTEKIRDFLPEELLSRFSSVVILDAPTSADLSEAIDRIHRELGIRRSRSMKELLVEAQGAQGAMRWLETYLCQLIVSNPYCVRTSSGSRQRSPNPSKETRSYDLSVADIPRSLAGANETSAKLNVKLAVIYSKLHVMSCAGRDKAWTGMLANPELGESIIRVLRSCQLLTTITSDDREELSILVRWRAAAWKTLTENADDLSAYGLTKDFATAWALAGALIEYRASLVRAAERGLLG